MGQWHGGIYKATWMLNNNKNELPLYICIINQSWHLFSCINYVQYLDIILINWLYMHASHKIIVLASFWEFKKS